MEMRNSKDERETVLGHVTPPPCLVLCKHLLDYNWLCLTACSLGKNLLSLSVSESEVHQFWQVIKFTAFYYIWSSCHVILPRK